MRRWRQEGGEEDEEEEEDKEEETYLRGRRSQSMRRGGKKMRRREQEDEAEEAEEEAVRADLLWEINSKTSPIDLDGFRRDPAGPKIPKIRFCASLARDILEMLCFDCKCYVFPRIVVPSAKWASYQVQ